MIFGNGDIAKALKEVEDKLPNVQFLAAGVSNSKERDPLAYERETKLVLSNQFNRLGHLVYFSTLSQYYSKPQTPYTLFKQNMEWLVRDTYRDSTIVRLGNIDWGVNPNTLINFMRNENGAGRAVAIRDEHRFILGKPEFQWWMQRIPRGRYSEMNIPGRMMTVQEIFDEYVVPLVPALA